MTLCYRDQWFCQFSKDCVKESSCSRALTDEVLRNAALWWSNGKSDNAEEVEPPFSLPMTVPDCHEPKEKV